MKNIIMMIVLSAAPLLGGAFAQGVNEADRMRAEADAFLKTMPEGQQDRQTAAVYAAMDGNTKALLEVRNSRNTPAELPEGVTARYVTPTMRLYAPSKPSDSGKPMPLLIYLHGGGWTFGSINSCSRFCGELAAKGGVLVLALDYRLAPEHPYPAALNDCISAIEFARSHAAEWGGSPDLISVGGDSSGGNLALASQLRLQKAGRSLHSLLLFYPVTEAWADGSESWTKYAKGYGLDADLMDAFNRAYSVGNYRFPLISPASADDTELAKLPPTLIIAAERDVLCDQGRRFYERVKKLGVNVSREVFGGTVHLFITVKGQETAFRNAVERASVFLRQ